jgi:general secretion pathway protein I
MKPSRAQGFTLLEVMVAVAILGVGLVAIFTSEVGAMNIGNRARRTDMATLLARCKMAELEEHVLNQGLPAIDLHDSGECCEGVDNLVFHCEWSMKRVILPDVATEARGDDDDSLDTFGAASLADFVPGGAGLDGMATMAVEMTFPILKPMIEDQVRRADVKISWPEGDSTQSFDVVQFLVAEQAQRLPGEDELLGEALGQGTPP